MITTVDHRFQGAEPWLTLNLREKRPSVRSGPPVLVVHGATIGSSALYDIPGASLLDALANAGLHVFALDVRGFGLSSRPAELNAAAATVPPLCRLDDAVADIESAACFVRAQTGVSKVALLGGSWGSATAGRWAASIGADRLTKLVLYAPVFRPSISTDQLTLLEDPTQPGMLNPSLGGWRFVGREESIARWRSELAVMGYEDEFESQIAERLMDCFLAAADPQDGGRMRVPTGPIADALAMFRGSAPFDPEAVRCPTLLIRGDGDQASGHGDTAVLFSALGSTEKRYEIIGRASHFVVAERQRTQLHQEICGFLRG